MEQQNIVLILLSTTLLAVMGAAAKLLSDIEHKKITKTAVIATGSFALFIGAVVGLIGAGFGWPTPFLTAGACLLGYLGKSKVDSLINRSVDKVADKVTGPVTTKLTESTK
jgi:hypothetical protein